MTTLRLGDTTVTVEFDSSPRRWQPRAPGSGWLAKTSRAMPVPLSADLRRILDLPYRPEVESGSAEAVALIDAMTRRFAKPPAPCRCRQISIAAGRQPKPCITRLRLAQAWALFEIGICRGLLGLIGVGHGKTLLDVLSLLALRARTGVLLVPPKLAKQLSIDYLLIAEHFWVPEIVVHGGKPFHHPVPGAPVLHVLPYSLVQKKEYTDWFEKVVPDAVIADEAHRLRNPDTATTSRVMRYFAAHRMTRFCGWTGTMTDQTVDEYAHLAGLALGLGSPLPLDREQVDYFSRALHFDEEQRCSPGALELMLEPGEHDIYAAYHRRLAQTEGVVTTSEAAVDVDLDIVERPAPPIPPHLDEMMAKVRQTSHRPDGELLPDGMSLARVMRELAAGFYYVWKFIHGETDEQILAWRGHRYNYFAELRQKLKARAEHLDSPLLCQHAAERFYEERPRTKGLPIWQSQFWPAWRDVRRTVSPISVPVWVSDYLARDAAQWALQNRGVVWYDSAAFGALVGKLSGLPVYGAGADASDQLAGADGSHSIIVSIPSHGTGTDGLQYRFRTQLVAQFPIGKIEQTLGRLHRVGQTERVRAEFYRHTPEVASAVDQALARAAYVQATTGADQKILGWME